MWWTLPALASAQRLRQDPRRPLVRRARARLKLRRTWATLLFDSADQLLEAYERETAGRRTFRGAGGYGGAEPQGVRQGFRRAVLEHLAERIQELGGEGVLQARPAPRPAVFGGRDAITDYDA
jgi:hypothetical protein